MECILSEDCFEHSFVLLTVPKTKIRVPKTVLKTVLVRKTTFERALQTVLKTVLVCETVLGRVLTTVLAQNKSSRRVLQRVLVAQEST